MEVMIGAVMAGVVLLVLVVVAVLRARRGIPPTPAPRQGDGAGGGAARGRRVSNTYETPVALNPSYERPRRVSENSYSIANVGENGGYDILSAEDA